VVEVKYRKTGKNPARNAVIKALDGALVDVLEAIRAKDYAGPFKLWKGELFGMGVAICGRNLVKVGFTDVKAAGRGE
jgi:hypothetical protein